MKIIVTGATGFVGRHLVSSLLDAGHTVCAVDLERPRAEEMAWAQRVEFIPCDVQASADFSEALGTADVLVHLVWPGLSNYRDLTHVEVNLQASLRFVRQMVSGGIRQVLVAGTCLEYGRQSGALSEDLPLRPCTAYGVAKNTLRICLEILQQELPFALQWVRLFYMYGPGQSPASLLAQLDRAIDAGQASFNMSGGEQLRDYLSVEEVGRLMAAIVSRPECEGIFNCCSGQPISVRRLVEQRLAERGAKMALNLGHYPYPDYEPMAFWGDRSRLDALLADQTSSDDRARSGGNAAQG